MWVVRRVLVSLLLVWAVATIVFFAIHLVPGDPAEMLLSQAGAAPTEATVERLRARLGLDRPVSEQYLAFLTGAMRADLGYSLVDGASVGGEIARRLPRTLELVGLAAAFSLLVGTAGGVIAALRRDRMADRVLRVLSSSALSVPVFVTGSLLVLLFAQKLRLVPAGGFVPFERDPTAHISLAVLPALSIAVGLSAVILRVSRAAVLDVLSRDYVRVARALGLPVRHILGALVLRNAAAPIMTITALEVGTLFGGTVLVEYVFNWPGLSGLLVEAVNARDYPMVVGVVLTVSVLYVLVSLIVDLLYGLLDPRVVAR